MNSASGWQPFDEVESPSPVPHPRKDRKRDKLAARMLKIDFLAERDGGRKCFYCDQPLEYDECTFDHYIPRAAKGTNSRDNLRIACAPCNHEKADTLP